MMSLDEIFLAWHVSPERKKIQSKFSVDIVRTRKQLNINESLFSITVNWYLFGITVASKCNCEIKMSTSHSLRRVDGFSFGGLALKPSQTIARKTNGYCKLRDIYGVLNRKLLTTNDESKADAGNSRKRKLSKKLWRKQTENRFDKIVNNSIEFWSRESRAHCLVLARVEGMKNNEMSNQWNESKIIATNTWCRRRSRVKRKKNENHLFNFASLRFRFFFFIKFSRIILTFELDRN